MRLRLYSCLLLALMLAGCGSGPNSSSTSNPSPAPPPTPSGGGSTGSGNLTTPVVVNVAANATTSGINITVPTTTSSFNVEMLGVNSPGATRLSAANIGGAVARGSSAIILIFGKGLTGSETLAFSGPNDIAISGETAVTGSDGTPGIEFNVTVASSAAVGARTLRVTNSSGSASAYVGGLEVY